jgi:hypothetical protein
MNVPVKRMALASAMFAAGCLVAGCSQGSNIKNAAASLSADQSVNASQPTISPPTRSPRTISPPTFAPKTRSPRPTREPVTVHVTTAPAVAPAPASSSALSAEPSPSVAASGSGGSTPWIWIVLALVVVAVVAALVARHLGRRSALATSWRSKVADACAKGSALHDAMSMAEVPGALDATEAGVRWADIQRRADEETQILYGLRESAPGEVERMRVADVLASLQALRSAMDAEHSPSGAGAAQHARVNELLASFEASLSALRSANETGFKPPPPSDV